MNSSKKIYNGLALVSAVTFGFSLVKLYNLFNPKKESTNESTSDFSGEKTIVFTLTNNTDKKQVEYLFDSRSGKDNSNVGISGNIKMFNEELSNQPKVVKKIEFRNMNSSGFSSSSGENDNQGGSQSQETPTSPTGQQAVQPVSPPVATPVVTPTIQLPPNQAVIPPATVSAVSKYNQSEAPFKMNCKDASGDAKTKQYIPLESSMQFQKGITTVKMDGQILDGTCYMKYTMFPNSKVAIVVYYEDYPLSDLLKKKSSIMGSVDMTSGLDYKKQLLK